MIDRILEDHLERVAAHLAWLDPAPFFFGASVMPLLMDTSELDEEFRPTAGVDVLLYLSRHQDAAEVERRLRAHGWIDDVRRGRKNKHAFLSPPAAGLESSDPDGAPSGGGALRAYESRIPVDFVMDRLYAEPEGLAEQREDVQSWPVLASRYAEDHTLPSGRTIRIPSPALFLACKIAASRDRDRWEGGYECHDLEDIAQFLVSSPRLPASLAASPGAVRGYVARWLTEIAASTTEYGEDAWLVLESNVPRASSLVDLQRVLEQLGRCTGAVR